MPRPADVLPRVITQGGEQVYAPWCDRCQSDERTKWDRLDGDWPDGLCLRCETVIRTDHLEAWRAREPSRLEARLAELLAEHQDKHQDTTRGAA